MAVLSSQKRFRTDAKVSLSFLITYLCVLAIPLAIALVIYAQTIHIIKDQTIRLQQAAQGQSVVETENQISKLSEIALQVYQNQTLSSLGEVENPNFAPKDILMLMQSLKSIVTLNLTSSNNEDFFLVYPENNLVLSNYRLNTDLAFAYRNFFSYDDMNFDAWIQKMSAIERPVFLPAHDVLIDQSRHINAITYIIPLKLNQKRMFISFLMDTSQLHARMSHGNMMNQTCLLDSEGNLLFYSGNEPFDLDSIRGKMTEAYGTIECSIGGERQIVTYSKSLDSGWMYLSILPSRAAFGSMYSLSGTIIALWAVSATVGLVAAYLFSRRSARPVSRMVSILKDDAAAYTLPGNVLTRIQRNIGSLISVNEDMQSRLSEQSRILSATYVDRILNGRTDQFRMTGHAFTDPLEAFARDGYEYVVAIVSLVKNAVTLNQLHDLCYNILQDVPGLVFHVHILSEDELALILGADAMVAEEKLNAVVQGLCSAVNTQADIAVGDTCASQEALHQSFDSALFALNYMRATNCGSVLWYSDVPADQGAFFYPPEVEQHIISNMLAGNEANLLAMKEQLFAENFGGAELSVGMKKCFLYNLFSTLVKLPPNKSGILKGIGDFRKEFLRNIEQHGQNYEETFDAIFEMFLGIAAEMQKGKRSHNQELIDSLRMYIGEQFSDCDLSMDAIAEQFDISQSYMSKLFKEQTGENFSDYLERVRILHACELLGKRDDCPIHEIARRCGYSNVYTFRRAFKRVKGVVPTEYKIQCQDEKTS